MVAARTGAAAAPSRRTPPAAVRSYGTAMVMSRAPSTTLRSSRFSGSRDARCRGQPTSRLRSGP